MEECTIKRISLFFLGVVVCVVGLPFQSSAQVTIKEKMELEKKQRLQVNAISIGTRSHNPGAFDEAGFITESSGKLHIYVEYLTRYQAALPKEAALQIQVKGVKDTLIVLPLNSYLDKDPIYSPLRSGCPDYWYQYGRGPFSYFMLPGPENGQDATTSSAKTEYRNYRDVNYGDSRQFGASEDPEGPIRSKGYGYLRFNLPTIDASKVNILSAEVELDLHQSNFEATDIFRIKPVAGSWDENSITWNNQPGIKASPMVDVSYAQKNRYDQFQIDVRPFVISWLSGVMPNYGFRFSVPDAAERKFIAFESSEEYYQFEWPYFSMEYENTVGTPTLPIREVATVATGDTVLISYENNAIGRNRALITGNFDRSLLDSTYYGRRFIFSNRDRASAGCNKSYYVTERMQGLVYIEKQENLELTMEVPGQDELWPTITSGGAQANFDRSQVKNSIEEILVEVSREEEPVPDQPVIIAAEWIEGSGGHNHNGGNDLKKPPLELMG